MIRMIWHRAAALALPVTLAICLPPMAVIAFALHAKVPAASAQTGTADSAAPTGSTTAQMVAQNLVNKPAENPVQGQLHRQSREHSTKTTSIAVSAPSDPQPVPR